MMKRLSWIQKAIGVKGKFELLASIRSTQVVNQQNATWITYYSTTDITSMFTQLWTTIPATAGIYLDAMYAKIQIANQDNADCNLWLYDCMLRNDSSTGTNPTQDWTQGLIDEGASTTLTLPFTTPFLSKRFCTRWKVKKVTKILLSSGAVHTHMVRMAPKHKINYERLTRTGGTGTQGALDAVGRLTHVTMIVHLGQVADDSVTNTNVGFAGSAIDVVYNLGYRFLGLTEDKTIYTRTNTLGAITTANIMNEKTGIVAVEVKA